jgi:hypothetical protein
MASSKQQKKERAELEHAGMGMQAHKLQLEAGHAAASPGAKGVARAICLLAGIVLDCHLLALSLPCMQQSSCEVVHMTRAALLLLLLLLTATFQ